MCPEHLPTRSLSRFPKTRNKDNQGSRNGSSISIELNHKHLVQHQTAGVQNSRTEQSTPQSMPQSSQDHASKIRCHNCKKFGHMKDCLKMTESTGNQQHSNTNRNLPSTASKQVTTDGAGDIMTDDPLDYLYSESGEEEQAVITV